MRVKLVKPALEHEGSVMAYKRDFEDRNDNLSGCGTLESVSHYHEWLEDCKQKEEGTGLNKDNVPSTQYLAFNQEDHLVGIINVRHHIHHPVLSTWGGHIGYSVLSKYRNQGYAKEMLKLALIEAKYLRIEKCLISCNKHNIASEKVILANGGVFDQEITVNGVTYKRFFIDLD